MYWQHLPNLTSFHGVNVSTHESCALFPLVWPDRVILCEDCLCQPWWCALCHFFVWVSGHEGATWGIAIWRVMLSMRRANRNPDQHLFHLSQPCLPWTHLFHLRRTRPMLQTGEVEPLELCRGEIPPERYARADPDQMLYQTFLRTHIQPCASSDLVVPPSKIRGPFDWCCFINALSVCLFVKPHR